MCMECCQGRSPFSQLRKDAFQKGAILAEAVGKWFDGSVLNLLVLKDRADLSLSSLVLELASSTLIVTLSRVGERSLLPIRPCLLESVSQDFKLSSLQLLLSILFLVTLGTDIIRDVINLVFTLLDCGVKLHSIVCCMSERLLKVGNLPWKLSLRRFVFGILLLNLGLVLQLNGLFFKHGAFHVFDHFFLFLPELVKHKFHSVNFLSHGDNFWLANFRVDFFLHFTLKLNFSFP